MKIISELARYFIKIEAIAIFGNSDDPRDCHARPMDGRAHAGGRSVNDPFTMQHIIHHATRCSPFRQNAALRARESRASACQNIAVPSALAFA
jgi:hypothetical protein